MPSKQLEQRFRIDQISRIKSLGEPAIYRSDGVGEPPPTQTDRLPEGDWLEALAE
jgi:hypothetical protein